ncbi:MAG: response regulator [Myxococcales bacterium]|nr:response regulator [Myxococcales bacterium]
MASDPPPPVDFAPPSGLDDAWKPSRLKMRFFLGASLVLAFALWWVQLMQSQQQASQLIEANVRALTRVHQAAATARRAQAEGSATHWVELGKNIRQLGRDIGLLRKSAPLELAAETTDRLQANPANEALVRVFHLRLDDFVLLLRRENTQTAEDMNALWRSLRGLALASMAFAGATLVLLIVGDRRQNALQSMYGRLKVVGTESANAREQAEHANATKSRFLGNLSHELRTPLTSVIGMIDLALNSNLDLVQRQQLETAGRSARSLLLLINDILDFARLEAGKLRFEIGKFAVRATIDEAVVGMAAAAQAKGLDVRVHVAPDVPAVWRGNGQRVRQVLTNLVSNAIKFTDRGEITIRATMALDQLLLAVHDTGSGMDAVEVPRLFEAFTQLDDSPTRRHGGAGLGLSICRELVEYMGGIIEVISSPGLGSTLTVQLPSVGIGENAGLVDRSPPPPPPLHWHRVFLDLAPGPCTQSMFDNLTSWGMTVRLQGQPAQADTTDELTIRPLRPELHSCAGAWAALAPLSHNDAAVRAQAAGARWLLFRPVRDEDLRALVSGTTAEIGTSTAPVEGSIGSESPASQSRPLVLVVEDDPVASAVITAMLRKLGCMSDLVGDGAEAIAATTARLYDLVLMDCQLPQMDGITATKGIRERQGPGQRRLPVVALTASGSAGDVAELQAAGMDDYLSKPTTLDQLSAMLVKHGIKVERRRRQSTTTIQST